MEYNWSIEKIKNQKRQIQKILLTSKNLTSNERHHLRYDLQNLTEMEKILLPNRLSLPQFENPLSSFLLMQENFHLFQNIPYYLTEIILKAIPYFQNYYDSYDSIELPKLNKSNKELVEMSHDFYATLPNKNYLKAFEIYTNPHNHLLHFTHDDNTNIMGITNFFYYPQYKPYFSINRDFTINDFLTLNHEIAHGIKGKKDSFDLTYKSHFFLAELEGFVFDYRSIQYLKPFFSEDVIHELEYRRFITMYEGFISFYIFNLAFKLYENRKKISITPIQKQFLKHDLPFYLDETILLQALELNPRITTKYLISFLTSLDLEITFEQDPDYAFYKFEKIRNNKTDIVFQNLRNNDISFTRENEDYIPLQKTIEKMNQLGQK